MGYSTRKEIVSETGDKFTVGNVVSIKWNDGGGVGGCEIVKITDNGFHYTQGGRVKNAKYENIREIS